MTVSTKHICAGGIIRQIHGSLHILGELEAWELHFNLLDRIFLVPLALHLLQERWSFLLPLIKYLSAEELLYRLFRGLAFKTAFRLFSLGDELANARVLTDREGLHLRKLLGPV
jgi:hypothetical protein